MPELDKGTRVQWTMKRDKKKTKDKKENKGGHSSTNCRTKNIGFTKWE